MKWKIVGQKKKASVVCWIQKRQASYKHYEITELGSRLSSPSTRRTAKRTQTISLKSFWKHCFMSYDMLSQDSNLGVSKWQTTVWIWTQIGYWIYLCVFLIFSEMQFWLHSLWRHYCNLVPSFLFAEKSTHGALKGWENNTWVRQMKKGN